MSALLVYSEVFGTGPQTDPLRGWLENIEE